MTIDKQSQMHQENNAANYCELLSLLTLAPLGRCIIEEITKTAVALDEQDWKEVESIASANHVVIRGLSRLEDLMADSAQHICSKHLSAILAKERARVSHAISSLVPICLSLEQAGNVIVIKSLDHWPDLGSDLDLYTDAEPAAVISIMRNHLHAQEQKRSWGDRLANKWNFAVPGLPELVEVHVGRLGQTGEQSVIGESLIARAVPWKLGPHTFRVPAPEDRIVISTLQRMFRHFYLRLCDIADISRLIEQRDLDCEYLYSLGQLTGLWDGLATYVNIVAEYAAHYGRDIQLPSFVVAAARFGSEGVRFRKNFLRIPILPQSARLYAAELRKLVSSKQVASSLRLSLLPALAAVAAMKQKIAGSDSGIW
jgi:hypothetical protein